MTAARLQGLMRLDSPHTWRLQSDTTDGIPSTGLEEPPSMNGQHRRRGEPQSHRICLHHSDVQNSPCSGTHSQETPMPCRLDRTVVTPIHKPAHRGRLPICRCSADLRMRAWSSRQLSSSAPCHRPASAARQHSLSGWVFVSMAHHTRAQLGSGMADKAKRRVCPIR